MAVFTPRFLRHLRDVLIGTPADGEVLTYDTADGKWKPAAGGGGGVTDHGALTGLADDDHGQYALLAPASSARNVIQPTAAGVIPLTVRAHAAQTAHVFQVLDEVGETLMAAVSVGTGKMEFGAAAYGGGPPTTHPTHISKNGSAYFSTSDPDEIAMYIDGATAWGLGPHTNSLLQVDGDDGVGGTIPSFVVAADGSVLVNPAVAAVAALTLRTAKVYVGAGSPEGVVAASVSSLFLRTDGAAGTSLYVKESGAGNTGWTAVAPGVSSATFNDHSARHENGGADEISVAGLSGLLADGQTPLSHNHSGADITSGTVADARIDAAIARDAEVAAGYQPLDADLTAIAAVASQTSFGRALLAVVNAGGLQDAAGLSAFVKTLMDDADASAFLTTLGVSTFIKTLLDDTDAATARATLGVYGIQPRVGVGRYSALAPCVNTTFPSSTLTQNIPAAMAFTITRPTAIDRVCIKVTAAVASATVRIGFFNDVGGVPGTLLTDFGTVTAASTGFKEITVSQTLQPGHYWGVCVEQGAANCQIQMCQMDYASRTDGDTVAGFNIGCILGPSTSGAFGGTFGALTDGPGNGPRIVVRGA